MKVYVLVFFISILFSACFDSNSTSLDENKSICLKEGKNFYVTELLDSNTQKPRLKVVCR